MTQADGTRVITPAWQNGLSNGALVGEIIGLAIVGQVTDRFGFRKTMMVGLACLTAFIFLLFFAKDLPMFVAGLVLCGIPWVRNGVGAIEHLADDTVADRAPSKPCRPPMLAKSVRSHFEPFFASGFACAG